MSYKGLCYPRVCGLQLRPGSYRGPRGVRSEAGNPRSGADRSGATYVGTMAQDLLETHPTAVITGDDGFYRVNYDQIDVDMMRLA